MCNFLSKPLFFITSAVAVLILNSCVKVEDNQEFRIVKICNNLLCHVEFRQVDVRLTTDIIGRTSEKIVRQTPLRQAASDIVWTSSEGDIATQSELDAANLPPCENNICTPTGNPTAFRFPRVGTFDVAINGTIVLPNGDTKEVNEQEQVDVEEDSFLQSITYKMPRNSVMTATQAAALFDNNELGSNLGNVIGNDSDNTLTFQCKPGFFIDPKAQELIVGGTQSLGIWKEVESKPPMPLFNGERWQKAFFVAAANDSSGPVIVGTGIDCGLPF